MDLVSISLVFVMISALAFFINSIFKYFKKKSYSSLLILLISGGAFFTYLFGFIRTFFFDNPILDSFFWKLSGISASLSSTASIAIAAFWTFFAGKSHQNKIKIFLFSYFVLISVSFFAFEPVKQVSEQGFVEWNLAFMTKLLVYLSAIITLISSFLAIYFGIKRKNKKPIIFGIGIFLGMLGLLLDAEALVDYVFFYKIIAASGILMMLFSSRIKG